VVPIAPQLAAAPNSTRNSTESNHPHYLEPGGCNRRHGYQKPRPRQKRGSRQRSRLSSGNDGRLRAVGSTRADAAQASACQTTTSDLTLVAPPATAITVGGGAGGTFLASSVAGAGMNANMTVHCCVMGVHSETHIYFRVRNTRNTATSAIAEQERGEWVWMAMPRAQAMALYAKELAGTHGPLISKCDLRNAAMSEAGYTCAVCIGLPPIATPDGWRSAPRPDAPWLERRAQGPVATVRDCAFNRWRVAVAATATMGGSATAFN
jgi:hypothetical protein